MGSLTPLRASAPGRAASPLTARGLRVVHVITSLEAGGAQAMLTKLVAARPPGDEACVLSLTDSGMLGSRLERLGVPVVAIGMTRGRPSVRATFRIMRELRRRRPDVVQTWLYHADLVGGVAAALLGIPVVWGVRHDRLLAGDPPLTRLVRRACAALSSVVPRAIVCNSEAARRTHAAAGFAPRRLVVVPNGFDLATFRPDARAREDVRRELGVSRDAPLVGMVARFHPHKDHATFLAAAARVRARLPAVEFVACGEGVEPSSGPLAALCSRHALGGRVHLLGVRTDVARITAALDIACLTSRTESFPNAVGEAMACAVPCVATDCGDVRELIGPHGRVVPVGDVEAVATAVVELLLMPEAAREALGAAARSRVRERFGLEAVAARFREIHRGASAPGGGAS